MSQKAHTDSDIDRALAPIAQAIPAQADLILDIRAAARERRHPGSCVDCFFQLVSSSPSPAYLHLLRSWLEQNIEIVARNDGSEVIEHVPLVLEGNDLETYCRSIMDRFHLDRAHESARIELEFCYR